MKRYILKILFFFLIIFIVDLIFGGVLQYMNDHSKGGGIKSRYYVCKESNEEVLIFGSSRAKHHYVPEIITDSLKMTSYNTGEDGNGIVFCYGLLKMITNRYNPKLIIYDLSEFDIYQDDNIKYLDLLKPFYYEPGVDTIFWSIEPKTRIMMHSNLYRFNTNCLRIIGNYIHPMAYYPDGYAPHYITMKEPESVIRTTNRADVDSIKISYMKKFISLAKERDIKLVFCISPYYMDSGNDIDYSVISRLLCEEDIPLLRYNHCNGISDNYTMFKDQTHLNDSGARIFTKILVGKVAHLN